LAPSKLYGLLAAGRVIAYIGPQEGRIPSLLRECEIGISVRNGQGPELLQALWALAADSVRWKRMAKLARQLAETRFDKPIAMAQHERLLFDVVGSR